MASSGLHGPHSLTTTGIEAAVDASNSPGAYALGRTDINGSFLISYIGRSDTNLNKRLKDHAGNYSQFKYGFLSSPKAAFEKESGLYHDFSPPDNGAHPARPKGTDWKCPRCKVFD